MEVPSSKMPRAFTQIRLNGGFVYSNFQLDSQPAQTRARDKIHEYVWLYDLAALFISEYPTNLHADVSPHRSRLSRWNRLERKRTATPHLLFGTKYRKYRVQILTHMSVSKFGPRVTRSDVHEDMYVYESFGIFIFSLQRALCVIDMYYFFLICNL